MDYCKLKSLPRIYLLYLFNFQKIALFLEALFNFWFRQRKNIALLEKKNASAKLNGFHESPSYTTELPLTEWEWAKVSSRTECGHSCQFIWLDAFVQITGISVHYYSKFHFLHLLSGSPTSDSNIRQVLKLLMKFKKWVEKNKKFIPRHRNGIRLL